MNITQRCPNCGNYIEGRKIKSYTNKVARQGAKTAVHTLTSVGGAATGAEIGTAICPGVGTVIGGALGFVGSAMFNQMVNSEVDKAGDAIEDKYVDMEYEFHCPKCGKTWTAKESELSNQSYKDYYESIDYKDEDENVDEFADFDENNVFSEFLDEFATQKLDLVKSNFDELNMFVDDCCHIAQYEIEDGVVKSKFYFLASIACYLYSNNCSEDKIRFEDVIRRGREYIVKSIELCDDDEYEILYSLFEIRNLELDDTNYSFEKIERILDNIPNPNEVDNCLINPKWWEEEIALECDLLNDSKNEEEAMNPSELEYLEMLKECLADGNMGVGERKLLEKIRIKYGISSTRAKELEDTLKYLPMSPEEHEYYQAYIDAIENGRISDKSRRLLDNLRKAYGISVERAKIIENQ